MRKEADMADPKRPNILVIWGDDIGMWNLSCYHRGTMGGRTPKHRPDRGRGRDLHGLLRGSRVATAGRAAFITGQHPFRTGLLKVGLPGAALGLRPEDPTIADLLKNHGYLTGQFGKNHLGDRNEYLPTVHGFDEFFGNLFTSTPRRSRKTRSTPRRPSSSSALARAAPCAARPPTGTTRRSTRASAGSASRPSRTPARSRASA